MNIPPQTKQMKSKIISKGGMDIGFFGIALDKQTVIIPVEKTITPILCTYFTVISYI